MFASKLNGFRASTHAENSEENFKFAAGRSLRLVRGQSLSCDSPPTLVNVIVSKATLSRVANG